jgi:hypothetical protein
MMKFCRVFRNISFLLVLFSGSGCVTTTFICPDDLPTYVGDDIVVTRTDGRVVRFSDGDYTVDTVASGVILRGEGRQYTDKNRSQSKSITDSIAVGDMASIEVQHKTIFHYTGPVLFVGALSLGVLLIILFALAGGHGVGG